MDGIPVSVDDAVLNGCTIKRALERITLYGGDREGLVIGLGIRGRPEIDLLGAQKVFRRWARPNRCNREQTDQQQGREEKRRGRAVHSKEYVQDS